MSIEERLSGMFERADATIERRPLDWNATIARARRGRRLYVAAIAFATAAVVAGGAAGTNALLNASPLSEGVPPADGRGDRQDGPPPGPTETPTAEPLVLPPLSQRGDCSARLEEPALFEDDSQLPTRVETARARILIAAVACDYERLETLTGPDFTYSFGESEAPGEYWRNLEAEGEDVMLKLVRVLTAPPIIENNLYTWPSAFSESPTDDDWQAVIDSGLYTQAEVDEMRRFGSYIGYRVGITRAGKWRYFVAGD